MVRQMFSRKTTDTKTIWAASDEALLDHFAIFGCACVFPLETHVETLESFSAEKVLRVCEIDEVVLARDCRLALAALGASLRVLAPKSRAVLHHFDNFAEPPPKLVVCENHLVAL